MRMFPVSYPDMAWKMDPLCLQNPCRFPGRNSTRFVDGHHLHHWADGGETSLNNLILLCKFHHRPDGKLVAHAPECATGKFVTHNGKKKHKYKKAWQWNGEAIDYGIAIDNLIYLDERKKRDC